ncbi:EAL domain-containing protein [Scandinavium lactucae]|uniref:EAL domain-containing protein n=1 Tax=Scandinavium lactucae TaxID=3095028 RepID=A0ABU4QPS8_9ENTR|nr:MULTISPECIES: EAL domain-containing protein [unclassified Scandinavium]MDX6040802.1 EAL domain-containing protein [Scandinavium sp. V105_6]MDX6051706.1 EAL domain-containing protein [Scandinavium sp. V105_1]
MLRFFKTSSCSLTGAIRTLFIAFYCMVFAIVSTVVYLDRQSLLDTMSHNLFVSKTSMLKASVENYINIPRQADSVLRDELEHTKTDNIPVSEVYADIINTMNDVYKGSINLNLLQFGNLQGDYIGVSHHSTGAKEEYLTLKDASTHHILTSYAGLSTRSTVSMQNPHYDIMHRPWYQSPNENRKPFWTPVYRDLNTGRELGIAYSVPAYNSKGHYIGVIASELHLQNLNKMLIDLLPYRDSHLLIMDEHHQIIASSVRALRTPAKSDMALPSLTKNTSPVITNIGKMLLDAAPNEVINTPLRDARYYASRIPITDDSGQLKWQAVLIVPASSIVSSVNLHDNFMIVGLILTFMLSATLVHVVLARITAPLSHMVQRTKVMESGQWPQGPASYQFKEIAELESSFTHLSQRLSDSFEQMRKKIEYDPVSGLYTRSGLLNDERIYQHHNLIALVHVTNMKSIMNTLGNKYADEFMTEFMQQAQTVLPTNIIVARDNIDKFIIVFPGMNQKSDYEKYIGIINSLFSLNRQSGKNENTNILFTGNAGMVLREITPDSITDILMHAWIALRHAEKIGNAQTRLYTPEMLETELTNIHLHDSFSGAMASNEIYLVIQPIVGKDDSTSCNEGECLVRWRSEKLGDIPPDVFIPVAEESGLIIPLGRWIIEEACRELAAMIHRGAPANFRLHINISAIQLLQQGFAWHLLDTIQLNGLTNENICIEITESVLDRDMHQAGQVLNYLRRHHILICLDDFGAGFSSLSYLHNIHFDMIKISRHLISNRLKNEKSLSVFNSLLILAKGFQVPLIAMGIEDAAMREHYFTLGCERVQGYHLANPVPFSSWFNDITRQEAPDVPRV